MLKIAREEYEVLPCLFITLAFWMFFSSFSFLDTQFLVSQKFEI